MERDRPRWRFRISTLMLLVVILALVSTLVVDRWKRLQNEQQLAASLQQALAQAEQARAAGRAGPREGRSSGGAVGRASSVPTPTGVPGASTLMRTPGVAWPWR